MQNLEDHSLDAATQHYGFGQGNGMCENAVTGVKYETHARTPFTR